MLSVPLSTLILFAALSFFNCAIPSNLYNFFFAVFLFVSNSFSSFAFSLTCSLGLLFCLSFFFLSFSFLIVLSCCISVCIFLSFGSIITPLLFSKVGLFLFFICYFLKKKN